MVTLIRENHHLLPVLNRFGIRLGFRDKSVQEVCDGLNINPDFFLVIVNTFHNTEFFPESEFLAFSPDLIIDYLKKTHQYYIGYIIPKLEVQLKLMTSVENTDFKEMDMISKFYDNFKTELVNHILDEESNVFPYVISLFRGEHTDIKNFSIRLFEKTHTDVETQINDLKNLIIKYINPVYDVNACNDFLITLSRFEKDLMDHARIEDAILIPMANSFEKSLRG
jgi:regulator of cell morphogenesis and NO signaling